MSKREISKADFEKYKRQIVLDEVGTDGQLKIANAKVLVIGAGGLSSPALQYLAGAGVGTLGIIDFDTISLSNIHRQVIYTTEDVGKSKAQVASQKLKKLNPDIEVLPYEFKLDKGNALKIIEKYDIVLDGSDSFSTRYLVNDACVILNKPLVFGAIYKFLGQVSVFNYKGGPTYRCAFPEEPEGVDIPNCSTIGVLGTLTGIIGSMQANEVLKIILGHSGVLSGQLLHIDTLSFDMQLIDIEKDHTQTSISELNSYTEESCGINEAKHMSVDEFNELKKKPGKLIIYQLSYSENKSRTIDNAQRVNMESLLLGKLPLPDDHTIVLVCDYGIQSESIAEYLQSTYKKENIYSLKDGLLGLSSS